jgi:hypothetical protein
MSIGDQSGHQINHEIGDAVVASVLNLGDVFELVMDGFDNSALAEQELIPQRQELRFHVLANGGNQLQALLEEGIKQLLGEIALVAEELAREPLGQLGHWGARSSVSPGSVERPGVRLGH